jgi:hypothetical protein
MSTDLSGYESDSSGTASTASNVHTEKIEHIAADISAAETRVNVAPQPIEKLTYRTVNAIVRQAYNDTNTIRSTALDILAIYLKSQKILYTEAKTFCERRLNWLMIPAILTTSACSIVSLELKESEVGALVVACLNGFNALLLALISYLKLDGKAEAHKISAYKYDKLQSYCEFKSGKILFLNDTQDNVNKIIDEIETAVKEIKETNQFVLPEQIRYHFRHTYGMNVFSSVKQIMTSETLLINRLKSIINSTLSLSADPRRNAEAIIELEAEQNSVIDQIVGLRDRYLKIDEKFELEISDRIRSVNGCNFMRWFTV